MDRKRERSKGVARVVSLHEDDGSFDRAFWGQMRPEDRLYATWDLTLEWLMMREPDAAEPRLQRSVCRVERR